MHVRLENSNLRALMSSKVSIEKTYFKAFYFLITVLDVAPQLKLQIAYQRIESGGISSCATHDVLFASHSLRSRGLERPSRETCTCGIDFP